MSEPAPIPVRLGARSYDVHVGAGILGSLGERARAVARGERAAIVTNPVVNRLHGEAAAASLRAAGFETAIIEVPDGDEHKNLAWLAFLFDRFLEAKLDRQSLVVALGGGVVGDLGGFAAATYLRGIDFIQVPTTLLAQVDASIGGKTGVNLAAGKNLIGAFHHPRLVITDVDLLKTLPRRELLAGMSEVIKHGAILSPELFVFLEEHLADVLRGDRSMLVHVVHANAQIKALVVAEDERESEYRAVLNFGHTLAHAVETLTEYREFLHGEAVSIGMAFALRLSERRGLLATSDAKRVIELLDRTGLPTAIPDDLRPSALALAMEVDKKRSGGRVKFVCLEAIGRTRFEMFTTRELQTALETAREVG